MPTRRKPLAKIPKEAHRVDETNKLTQERRDSLDSICSEKVKHPLKKKLMTLADSIEYIGNCHRTRLSQSEMFPRKEANDAYIQELRKLSRRLHKVLNETLYEDKSINLSRARNLGVSPATISSLNENLNKLQPDLDRAKKWNIARLLQKIERIDRCLVLDDVEETFERYGLNVSHYEDAGEKAGATHRSDFYECVYLALAHAGDTVERISKVHEHCKKSKYKEPTK